MQQGIPFRRHHPSDPTRPITTIKTEWKNVRKNAKVTGRWYDNRNTLITDLAETDVGAQTIMDIADHVHADGNTEDSNPEEDCSELPTNRQHFEAEYPQESYPWRILIVIGEWRGDVNLRI